jgi:hypothetical protein
MIGKLRWTVKLKFLTLILEDRDAKMWVWVWLRKSKIHGWTPAGKGVNHPSTRNQDEHDNVGSGKPRVREGFQINVDNVPKIHPHLRAQEGR